MNTLLAEQLSKYLGETANDFPPHFVNLLTAVSESYTNLQVALETADREKAELSTRFENIQEGLFSVDVADGKTLYISKSYEQIFGYALEDFYSNYNFWFEMILEEDKPRIMGNHAILALGKPFSQQYRVLHKNGTVRWIESKLTPVLNKLGEVVRIDGISSDITDRKLAEAALIVSEKKYRGIVETAQEGILTYDKYNRINFVNQKLCGILGYDENELKDRDVLHLVADDYKPNSMAALQRRRQGVKETFELRMVAKGGMPVWANICANPIFGDNGHYNGGLAMITDITEKKNQELLRLRFEANLQTIFNNTDSSYVLMDASLKIVSFNRVAQTVIKGLLGLQLAEGHSILDFCFPERVAFVREVIDEAMTGEPVVYDAYFTQLNGVVRWYEIKWLCVRNQDEEIVGIILSGVDVTDRMGILQEHQKITADLIRRNKDLQQFTYMVSHNLRAPIANIMALATLLKEEDNGLHDNTLVEGIALCVQKLDAITKDMNLILQVRQQVNEKKETIYFNQLAESVINALQERLTKEHAVVNWHFDSKEHIFSVRSYVYSIFYTLILNGIKYRRPKPAPVINVMAARRENNIVLVFEDNGTGIDLEKHGKHMFVLYKRFDLNVEGRGTGLFMIKSQIEQLGGTISVQSEVNKGSVFTITLPA